jgi:hypothetical protein
MAIDAKLDAPAEPATRQGWGHTLFQVFLLVLTAAVIVVALYAFVAQAGDRAAENARILLLISPVVLVGTGSLLLYPYYRVWHDRSRDHVPYTD